MIERFSQIKHLHMIHYKENAVPKITRILPVSCSFFIGCGIAWHGYWIHVRYGSIASE